MYQEQKEPNMRPESSQLELESVYNSIPTQLPSLKREVDTGSFLARVNGRRKSEHCEILKNKLQTLLSRSQLTPQAQEFTLEAFDDFYISGRRRPVPTFEDGVFRILLDTKNVHPHGVFSRIGAGAAERLLLHEAEYHQTYLEDRIRYETVESRQEVERKAQRLQVWKKVVAIRYPSPN